MVKIRKMMNFNTHQELQINHLKKRAVIKIITKFNKVNRFHNFQNILLNIKYKILLDQETRL